VYKHILAAVDGSDTSNLALAEAVRLAKEQQGAIRLIHVIDETPPYSLSGGEPFPITEYENLMREAGAKLMADVAAKVRETGVAFDTKCPSINLLTRRICDVISDEAKSWPADLIVIGTHGRHGFDRLFLGSVAEGVIRIATKPVLIIHGT
jgi:nucleotide-binding universal stress UspA family protein